MVEESFGKKIKKIKYIKNKAVIIFDDGDELNISLNTFAHFYLYENKTLTKQEWEEISYSELLDKQKTYAVNLLSKKVYTEKEVRLKLYSRNVKKEDVDKIIDYLKDNHFLNDERYASIYLDEYIQKGYGEFKIRNSLKEKGIDENIIEDLIFDEEVQKEIATKIGLGTIKKNIKSKSSKAILDSIERTLRTRGYSSNIVRFVLSEVEGKTLSNEDEVLKIQIDKYLKAHRLDLKEKCNVDKVTRHFLSKGFKYGQICKFIKEDTWKS